MDLSLKKNSDSVIEITYRYHFFETVAILDPPAQFVYLERYYLSVCPRHKMCVCAWAHTKRLIDRLD